MSEQRVDPEDGGAYTYEELASFYRGKYGKKEIKAYWETLKVKKTKGKAKAEPKGKAKAKAKAKVKAEPKGKAKAKAKAKAKGKASVKRVSVMRLVSYKCKAGKEAEFSKLIEEMVAEWADSVEGYTAMYYTKPDPQTLSMTMQFKSQEFLDKYMVGFREKYLEKAKPLLEGGPAYSDLGPMAHNMRKRDAAMEPGKAVLRNVSYKCVEGKEKEFKKEMTEIISTIRKEVEGWAWCGATYPDPRTICGSFVFESQEKLDAYRTGVREKLLEKVLPLLDGGKPLYDETGLMTAVTKTISKPVLRLVSYKCKAGKEAEFAELVEKLVGDWEKEVEGYTVMYYTMPDPQTLSLAMQFRSQELLDKYRAGVRDKFLDKMKPLLEGGPVYDHAGALMKSFRKKEVTVEPGKAVLRFAAVRCLEGKEEEWAKVAAQVLGQFRKDVKGYSWAAMMFPDPRTLTAAMVFESQEALDTYRAGLREKFLAQMDELMDKSGKPLDESGPVKAAMRYSPKSVEEAWKNHFDSFGSQNLNTIMLDYDELSVARVFNNTDEKKHEYKGVEEIRGMFASLFGDLKDLKSLAAPVVDVDEEGRQVFLVWHCKGCNYHTATDTFIFRKVRGQFKILRQNIVLTKK